MRKSVAAAWLTSLVAISGGLFAQSAGDYPELTSSLASRVILRMLACPAEIAVLSIRQVEIDDARVVLDGIRAGARGFMLKDVSYEQLIHAIRAIAAGETVFQPAVTERLLRAGRELRPRSDEADEPVEALTGRERDVVRLMAGATATRRSPTRSGPPKERSRTTCRAFSRNSASATERAPS